MSDAWDFATSAVDAVVGDSNDPGALGLSKQKLKKHDVDKANFQNPNSQANQDELRARQAAIDSRQGPTMQNTQVGAFQNAKTQQSQPYQGSGAIERAGAGTLGAASQSATANIARGEDQQVGAEQMALIQSLREQAAGKGTGQQLAENAYNQANERGLKNAMALAASRRGTQAPSTAGILEATAGDRRANAAALSSDKMKAALEAQNMLGQVVQGARGQDIGVNTSQAGFLDATNGRNQDANNQFALQQFAAGNDMAKFNAGNFIQNQQFNAGNMMQNNQFNAKLAADVGMFNAGQQNERTSQQAQMDLATKQANLEAQLKSQGMNDEMAKFYSQQILAQQEADRQANIDYEGMLTQQDTGMGALEQKSFESARAARQNASGGAAEAGADILKSDRRSKTEVRLIQPDTWFLSGAR